MSTPPAKHYQNRVDPDLLQAQGPLLTAEIRLPESVRIQRNADPMYRTTSALVDTGADNTCISLDVAKQLQLVPIDAITVNGAHGPGTAHRYSVDFTFPGSDYVFKDWNVIAMNIDSQGLGMLIGRDVLRHSLLAYDGVTGDIAIEIPSQTHPMENGKMFAPISSRPRKTATQRKKKNRSRKSKKKK